ncbi:MAG TPA: biotin--[acetyl-CoA-carboxylase] ligase [Fluviicoccus sp.]|nr:biotin--[acetyl-CoA-carboxylase] ligase [Fluviicoccus sp.]
MKLLRLLSKTEFMSGVDLAQKLNVSRTTISNHMVQWRERGVGIDVVPGLGYRLTQGIDFLDEMQLVHDLRAYGHERFNLTVRDIVGSTNDIAAKQLGGATDLVVSLAEYQESGRGRRGRSWQSPPGAGLVASIGWRTVVGVSALQGLSLAVGVVILEAMESMGFTGLALKWPNDIVSEKGKVGGILIELSGEIDGPSQVVIGVGLNLYDRIKLADYPVDALMQMPEDATRSTVSRHRITLEVLNAVMSLIERFPALGFGEWRDRWIQRDFYRDREVVLLGYQEPVFGIARGVDATGGLLVENDKGLVVYSGGELSMRPVI